MFSHALYLYMLAQLAPQPLYNGPWVTTAPLLKIKTDPIIAVTLVPTEKGWLLVAGSRTFSSQGELTCDGNPPRTITVVSEGHPRLVLSLECPKGGVNGTP